MSLTVKMTQHNGELSSEFIDSVGTDNNFQTVIQMEEKQTIFKQFKL